MRLFISLPVSVEIKDALGECLDRIGQAKSGVKWSNPDLWHITLKFLGEIAENRLADVTSAMARATAGIESFTWACQGLGAFPDLRQPAVLWAGVGKGGKKITRLAAALAEQLEVIGCAPERRPFHPHLTLGRIREKRGARRSVPVAGQVSELFRGAAEREFGQAHAGQVELVQSRLLATGPKYCRIDFIPLQRILGE